MSNPLSEQEKRDEVIASLVDYNTYVNSDVAINRLLKLIDKVGNQREVAGRIDENENWARHIGAVWDGEVVNHEDIHKRLGELKAQQGEQDE